MRFKRDINFSPSITLSVVQRWNAVVSYPIQDRRNHQFDITIVIFTNCETTFWQRILNTSRNLKW